MRSPADHSPRLTYISAEYPKVSHTFIGREVEALRRLGAHVDTVSIRRTPEAGLLSESDRREAAGTFAVLPVNRRRLIAAHARWALTHPRRYAATLALAFASGPPGARQRLWQLFYFVEAVLVADEMRRRGSEHVHAHFVNVAGSVAMLGARLCGLPWSFTMHGPLEFDNVLHFGVAEKVRDARFVACISDFCRAQLMRLVEPAHWDKLHVVHCGVEPAQYAAGGVPRAGGAVEIVSVGRLDAMKGFAVLLDAVALLADEGAQLRLTLIGDGPQREALEAAARDAGIADAVTFTGALGAPEVTAALGRADVFCLPSFAEGVPVVLMEAMAACLPVVTTQVMGIPELVRDGESGLLVAPGRPEPLAAALRVLVADEALRGRMGAAGRAAVEQGFDVSASARRLLELFTDGEPPVNSPP